MGVGSLKTEEGMISQVEFKDAISNAVTLLSKAKTESRTFTLSVKKRFDGFTLLDLYAESFPHVEREYWRAKIENGNLVLDGKKTTSNQKVKSGQITQHSVPPKDEPKVSFDIELIKATNDYWVINKPSPLPVHAGGRYQNNTLTHILKTAFPNQSIHLINRLDANTTGIVLVALHKETAQNLGKQFENREVIKTYLALVEGIPKNAQFQSSKSISKTKTPAGGRKLEEGRESNTDFEILKTFDNKTLLKVTPHSGRTNQIRLHLADLGFPIVGDLGYKNLEYFKNNPLTYPNDSLFLHAWKLRFYDSNTQQFAKVEAGRTPKWSHYI